MALLFDDALSQYLTAASVPVSGYPLTMACWFNADDDSTNGSLMHIADSSTNSRFALVTRSSAESNHLRFVAVSVAGGGDPADTTTGYVEGTWHSAIGVGTSSTDRAVYLDNAGVGTNTDSNTPIDLDRFDIGVNVVGGGTPTLTAYMSGMIAEAAVWNVALGASDRAMLAARVCPLLVKPENLVYYNPFSRSSLIGVDRIGGLALTAPNSISNAPHPRIIYPASTQSTRFAGVVPPAVTIRPEVFMTTRSQWF